MRVLGSAVKLTLGCLHARHRMQRKETWQRQVPKLGMKPGPCSLYIGLLLITSYIARSLKGSKNGSQLHPDGPCCWINPWVNTWL
jgi:hypothetical protein